MTATTAGTSDALLSDGPGHYVSVGKSNRVWLPPGTRVTVLDRIWVLKYKVKYKDRVGYLSSGDFISSSEKPNDELLQQRAIAANRAAASRGQKLTIQAVYLSDIDSAGGSKFAVEWAPLDASRVVKYAYFTATAYNAVNDTAPCKISGKASATARVTGPIEVDFTYSHSAWAQVWYNAEIMCVKLDKVVVEYTDGSQDTYAEDLPKILGPDVYPSHCR